MGTYCSYKEYFSNFSEYLWGLWPEYWLIDPLDGTTNYAHGFPWFAVSIALEVKGRLELGVVYNPYVGDFYVAERGSGAFLNERRLKVSTIDTLERSLLATGFAYDHKKCKANNYDYFKQFQKEAQACRRPGAASLDLASVGRDGEVGDVRILGIARAMAHHAAVLVDCRQRHRVKRLGE